MNVGRIFELAGISDDGILLEAAYDGMIASLKKDFPNSIKEIDDNIKQAKTILKKQDRMVWYIKILRAYLNNDIKRVSGNYNFISMNMFNEDLFHYYGYNIGDIENIEYKNQNISELFETLQSYINKYQQSDKAPVPVRKGDYELIKCNDGTSWWFVDRSYCSEEGRSGKHCGNVMGKHDKTQRILSLRSVNHNVILTFILLENGYLGEMKAKANLKPAEKYHANIMQLLLNPMIKGIKGAGAAPWMNFSIFDLPENDITVLINHGKKSFIIDQIVSEPMEFLKAPEYIKANKEYQQVAIQKLPELKYIIGKENDLDAWETAIRENESLIIYAPNTLKDFKELVIYYLQENAKDLMKAPKYISQDFDILKEVVEYNGYAMQYIMPTTPRYEEICKIAVSNNGVAIEYVPEELRTLEICKLAVSDMGIAIEDVPEEMRTLEICKIAVSNYRFAIQYVPDHLKDKVKQELNIQESLDFSYFRML